MCRRTRVAFVNGDRSEQSCRRLWDKAPLAYRRCLSYNDFWKGYQEVLPKETPLQSAKKADSYPYGALVLYIATKASTLCP